MKTAPDAGPGRFFSVFWAADRPCDVSRGGLRPPPTSTRDCFICGARRLGAPNHTPNHESFCYVKRRERRFQRPFLFPCRKKKRFLESKEKGAPVRVEWLQIGIRRPGFTPPLSTSTVHRRLRRWNRESRGSIRPFFAACVGGCRNVAPLPGIPVAAAQVGCFGVRRSSTPIHSSLFPLPFTCGARRPRRALNLPPVRGKVAA